MIEMTPTIKTPSREETLYILNRDALDSNKWLLEEVVFLDHQLNTDKAYVYVYDSKNFYFYCYKLIFKECGWQIDSFVPIDWTAIKIGFNIFLEAEIKALKLD